MCATVTVTNALQSPHNWRKASGAFDPVCLYSQQVLEKGTFSREHIVPQSKLKALHNGRQAAHDLHNLWPVHTLINTKRSNYRFDECSKFADNTWYLDTCTKSFFPPKSARGTIARVCLYMLEMYDVDTDAVLDPALLRLWSQLHPNKQELRHHSLAAKLQGNYNQHVFDALHIAKKFRQ